MFPLYWGILLIIGVLFFNEKRLQNVALSSNSKWYLKFKNSFGTYIRKKTFTSFIVMGMLNGLLPCAMIYMELFGATATIYFWKSTVFLIKNSKLFKIVTLVFF